VSEITAYEAFRAHTAGCGTCKPPQGLACDEGRGLHDAWRQAADAYAIEQRKHEAAHRRGTPVRRRRSA
jgi:hypothetical protein